ncbi:3-mercaptopyruvate sulfurtransferase [Pigmentiphaga humi]|uniref:Sulfurtransferase n=1 Tax=Pigmentiphaga humi TaxID=2478468 RepID=A0A3P4AWV7_9BURK|nr:sulfurtransferase [Pigmentiphaga humi]VCU68549.1 3-mercaptopyruvate sulfurtransferase [Pigmentiphaga humi]
MRFTTLISPQALHALQQSETPPLVCNVSFDLADPDAGERAHAASHLPGAVYVHLDRDLSGAKTGANGRHPLPARADFAAAMARLGADDRTQVVCYDNAGGAMAARLWWLLRWAGHADAAVLDGGLQAWEAAGLPLESGAAAPRGPAAFTSRPSLVETVDYDAMLANLSAADPRPVLDARAPDRFRGENETLDAVGGHIPGATNRFLRNNLEADGRFKQPEQLRAEFTALLGTADARRAVSQCGSGVTACHNLLALEVAGLPGAALYPGSWSEWSSREGSPIATGER